MDIFDSMAKDFDTDVRAKRAKVTADEIRMHIVDGRAKSAIEYGCGTGLVGLQLINDFNTLLFVDSSAEMIKQLERKLDGLNVPSASALCYDFLSDIPPELHADYIFSSMVVHHIKDIESVLSHFYNILRTNGHLLIVDLDKEDGRFHADFPNFDGHNGFEHSFLSKLTAKAGFIKTEIKTYYYDSKIVNGETAPYSLFILDAVK